MESGLYFSKRYDELPKKIKHISLLVNGVEEDLSKVSRSIKENSVAWELKQFYQSNEGRNLPEEYKSIIQKYSFYTQPQYL